MQQNTMWNTAGMAPMGGSYPGASGMAPPQQSFGGLGSGSMAPFPTQGAYQQPHQQMYSQQQQAMAQQQTYAPPQPYIGNMPAGYGGGGQAGNTSGFEPAGWTGAPPSMGVTGAGFSSGGSASPAATGGYSRSQGMGQRDLGAQASGQARPNFGSPSMQPQPQPRQQSNALGGMGSFGGMGFNGTAMPGVQQNMTQQPQWGAQGGLLGGFGRSYGG
jgi:hypothetical protein